MYKVIFLLSIFCSFQSNCMNYTITEELSDLSHTLDINNFGKFDDARLAFERALKLTQNSGSDKLAEAKKGVNETLKSYAIVLREEQALKKSN